MEFDEVEYAVEGAVAVISLNRPHTANAQSFDVLLELDAAWQEADRDPEVKAIVLRSEGRHFSSGHDISPEHLLPRPPETWSPDWNVDWETRGYMTMFKRWREIPKPSIAAVQGKCIAGGLMLCWPCDLIVAADNAEFSDPVLAMGIGGIEWNAHTWEFGARKAKELLFTGGSVSAEEAHQAGMVNRVVPLDELMPATMQLAHRIAEQDPFALRMAKRAVNNTLEIQGYYSSVDHAFMLHQLAHARASSVSGRPTMVNLDGMKDANRQS